MKAALAMFGGLVAAFALVTWWALEGGGVAVVETHAPDGTIRSTRVWYVEPGGELLLEAGTPENAWFQDLQHEPRLTFKAGDLSARYVALPIAGEDAHRRVRSLMRAKYGLRDRWVGLLADLSRSIAIELSPVAR